jgi:hypothetical protein
VRDTVKRTLSKKTFDFLNGDVVAAAFYEAVQMLVVDGLEDFAFSHLPCAMTTANNQ